MKLLEDAKANLDAGDIEQAVRLMVRAVNSEQHVWKNNLYIDLCTRVEDWIFKKENTLRVDAIVREEKEKINAAKQSNAGHADDQPVDGAPSRQVDL